MTQKPTHDELIQRIHELEARLERRRPEASRAATPAAKEAQSAKEMLQLVMDNIPQFIFWKDRNSVYLGCNRNFARAAGVGHPDAIRGKTDYDLVWKKEEADFFRECDQRVMETDTPEYHIIEPQLQADGRQTWLNTNKVPLHDADGKVVGILGTYEDITDRKQTQEALRLYHRIVDTTDDMMSMIGPDYTYLAVNDAYVKAHRKPRKAIVGCSVASLLGTDFFETYARPNLERAFAGEHRSYETWIQYPENGRRYMRISYYPYQDADGTIKGVVVNAHDNTLVKQLENKLIQAQKLEAVGTLAGGLAHDFNNLLMGISGRTSLMAARMQTADPLYAHLQSIEKHVHSATALTSQLLGFARGGKYEVNPTDFNRLIGGTLEMFARTKKEIQVVSELGENLWPVEVDGRQMEQVLLNIFVNAGQAMPGGGRLTITTANQTIEEGRQWPAHVSPGRYILVTISDTGEGMPESVRKRIFDPFFTTKAKKRGTGLGLASAYGIIQNHGGFIDVSSQPGEGSTFRIYLPASDKTPRQEKKTATTIVQGTETILIADDENVILNVGSMMLGELGYEVLTATSGAEAVATYQADPQRIDLVILDMIMPEMSGSDTFDRLKAINPDVRILLSSGYSIDGAASAIIQKGCRGFIQKPFNLGQLSEKVRKALDDSKG